MKSRSMETDYLVVGAGAMGMAFTDAVIEHADVHVTLVDRRHASGGHWQDAYPFVQLHQASLFYGVASTVLGEGVVQQRGPEAGLQERARRSEIQHYYDSILYRRFISSGRVDFLGASEYHTDGTSHSVTSHVSGETTRIDVRRRVVDATYLSPTIPATTPPPFGVADGARVIAINELAAMAEAASRYVIVGSGKTATDGIVWLLANGVQPDRIVWVRPREPWMLNRAVVQPDPVVALGLVADTMEAAAEAGQSRVNGGIHFQSANREGRRAGQAIGRYVVRNFLVSREALRLTISRAEDLGLVVRWPAGVRLESSEDLSASPWNVEAGPGELRQPLVEPRRFFRLGGPPR